MTKQIDGEGMMANIRKDVRRFPKSDLSWVSYDRPHNPRSIEIIYANPQGTISDERLKRNALANVFLHLYYSGKKSEARRDRTATVVAKEKLPGDPDNLRRATIRVTDK